MYLLMTEKLVSFYFQVLLSSLQSLLNKPNEKEAPHTKTIIKKIECQYCQNDLNANAFFSSSSYVTSNSFTTVLRH